MSVEVKVRYQDVEDAVIKIESASASFKAVLLKDMASGNTLDVVKKMNDLNEQLVNLGNMYKNLLNKDNEAVRQTLKELQKVDQNLSNSIRGS